MARINNTLKESLAQLLPYMHRTTALAEEYMAHENQTSPPLDATYKAGRATQYKLEAAKLVKALRWFLNEYSITTPSAFTDAQIDAEDPNIRTHEE